VLSVILASIGAILLSISLFDTSFNVKENRHEMGIAGIVLTSIAIALAAVTGY
jgi:hypothetical protein